MDTTTQYGIQYEADMFGDMVWVDATVGPFDTAAEAERVAKGTFAGRVPARIVKIETTRTVLI